MVGKKGGIERDGERQCVMKRGVEGKVAGIDSISVMSSRLSRSSLPPRRGQRDSGATTRSPNW